MQVFFLKKSGFIVLQGRDPMLDSPIRVSGGRLPAIYGIVTTVLWDNLRVTDASYRAMSIPAFVCPEIVLPKIMR